MRIMQVITDYITKSLMTVLGDMVYYDGTNPAKLARGAANQFLAGDAVNGVEYKYVDTISDIAHAQLFTLKWLNIGIWDMDLTDTLNVPHGLGADWEKVQMMEALILSDSLLSRRSLSYVDGAGVVAGGIARIDTTYFYLRRAIGGFFDSVAFSSTGIFRGKIFYIMTQ